MIDEEDINIRLLEITSKESELAEEVVNCLDSVFFNAASFGVFPENREDIFKYRRSWGDGDLLLEIANKFRDGYDESKLLKDYCGDTRVNGIIKSYNLLKDPRHSEKIKEICDLALTPLSKDVRDRVMYRALITLHTKVIKTNLTQVVKQKILTLIQDE